MKLISCNVVAFGALKDYRVSFSNALTELSRDNGTGKTTLATFLKSMLYGMESVSTKKKGQFSDREHFCPFDGENFGGVLLLEANGKEYRIERSFDKKSEKKDVLTVYEDGVELQLSDDRHVGEALLGVNKETFERTLFTTSDDICVPPNSDIKTKLGCVIQGEDDADTFDTAIIRLDESIKKIKLSRKSKTSTALIDTVTARITDLHQRIINIEQISGTLDDKYKEESQLEIREKEISNQISALNSREAQKAQRAAYDRLISEIKESESKRDELNKSYPNGLPTDSDINEIRRLQSELSSAVSKKEVEHFTPADKKNLQNLKIKFSAGTPTKDELDKLKNDIDQHKDAIKNRNALSAYTDSEEDKKLRHRFSTHRPSEKELENAKAELKEYGETKARYDEAPAFLISAAQNAKTGFSAAPYVICAIIAALIAIAGAVILATVTVGAGAALTAVGAVILIVSGFLYLNKKTSAQSIVPQSTENTEKTKLNELLRKKENALLAFLLPYGYNSELGLEVDMKSLCDDLSKYEALVKQDEKRVRNLEALNKEINGLKNSITAFFGKYGMGGDDFDALHSNLTLALQSFNTLVKREKDAEISHAELDNQISDINKKLELIQKRYLLSTISPEQLTQDKKDLNKFNDEIAKKSQKAENYRNEHGITDEVDTSLDALDPEKLKEDLNTCQSELAALRKKIQEDETETEKLDGYHAELTEAKERLEEYKNKHRLLTVAKDLLTKANDDLNNRYVKPVLDEFLANTAKLDNALGREMTVNREFDILFEHGGKLRSEAHLSAGQRTLCALCFRISLIKNMYGGAIPFMILDDPFLTLDEGNMEKAKLILKDLAEDTQILYFTCHPSRNINCK